MEENSLSYLTRRGIPRERIRTYKDGLQINVADKSGIIQTFYPTTGTIVLHRSNRWQDYPGCNSVTIPGRDVAEFWRLITTDGAAAEYFA